ncbi:MAG TPA: hypothetical protein VLY87_04095 [Flavobacterium sp.]|nr:hypothetical protein [Flavobacterium sp.]
MEITEIAIYLIIFFVLFFICVFISRWIYKINEMVKYQKVMSYLLLTLAEKEMEENSVKIISSLINGTTKIEEVHFKVSKKKEEEQSI